MTPNDQTSLSLAWKGEPFKVSGPMNAGLPADLRMTSPVLINWLDPKSAIWTRPEVSSKRFASLRSPCPILLACRYSSPCKRAPIMREILFWGNLTICATTNAVTHKSGLTICQLDRALQSYNTSDQGLLNFSQIKLLYMQDSKLCVMVEWRSKKGLPREYLWTISWLQAQ